MYLTRSHLRKLNTVNHLILSRRECVLYIFQFLHPGFWAAWLGKNRGCTLFAVLALMRRKPFSKPRFYLVSFEILQEEHTLLSFSKAPSTQLLPLQWLRK